MKYMTNVLGVISGLFATAIRGLYPGYTHLKGVVQGSGGKFGDYKCVAAMSISQVSQPQYSVCHRVSFPIMKSSFRRVK